MCNVLCQDQWLAQPWFCLCVVVVCQLGKFDEHQFDIIMPNIDKNFLQNIEILTHLPKIEIFKKIFKKTEYNIKIYWKYWKFWNKILEKSKSKTWLSWFLKKKIATEVSKNIISSWQTWGRIFLFDFNHTLPYILSPKKFFF